MNLLNFHFGSVNHKIKCLPKRKRKVQLVYLTLAIKYRVQKFISLLYDCIHSQKLQI